MSFGGGCAWRPRGHRAGATRSKADASARIAFGFGFSLDRFLNRLSLKTEWFVWGAPKLNRGRHSNRECLELPGQQFAPHAVPNRYRFSAALRPRLRLRF